MTDIDELIGKALRTAERLGCKYAEARVQRVRSSRLEVRDGTIKSATPGVYSGLSVRLIADNSWGFASTSVLSMRDVERVVERAFRSSRASGEDSEEVILEKTPIVDEEIRLNSEDRASETPFEAKVKLCLEIDGVIRKMSPSLGSLVNYVDHVEERYVGSTDGSRLVEESSWIYLNFTAFARENGNVQSYRRKIGVLGGFERIWRMDYMSVAIDAAERALELLRAERTPSGRMTVVIDGDLAGLLAHEAFGHATEADLVLEGLSVLEGKIGQRVATGNVTLVDDASLRGAFGSYHYDDEGIKARRKILVQSGVLKGYLTNRETSFKLGLPLTGNARAERYDSPPIVRMSNTFFEPGDMDVEELIEDVKFGVYALGGRGGQVSPVEGVFQFGAQEAYLIERGRITKTLKDFSFSGKILESLKKVSGVGRDFTLSPAFCGKEGQIIRVSSGGPHLRIEDMMVGGWV